MKRLKSVGFEITKLIESVAIELHDYRFIETAKASYQTDLDGCEELVVCIRDSGLMAHHVIWPGIHEDTFNAGSFLEFSDPHSDGETDAGQWKDCVEMNLLNTYILPPLLKRYGMLDRTRPPVDVRERLANYRDTNLPPAKEKEWKMAFDHLKRVEPSERFDHRAEQQEAEEDEDGFVD